MAKEGSEIFNLKWPKVISDNVDCITFTLEASTSLS